MRFNRRPCWISLAVALTCTARASAQDMQAVQVQGARYDQRREDTASSIVIGRDDLLRQGDRTLAEALKRVPGISIGDGAGNGSEIRMRGLGGGYTQILLNGVPAPAGYALDALAPELIERVEILRSASAELGTQAIAGTINIILRKNAPRAQQEVKLTLDAQGKQRAPGLNWQSSGKGEDYSYTVVGTAGRTASKEAREEADTQYDVDGRLLLSRRTPELQYSSGRALSLAPRVTWGDGGDALSVQGFVNLYERGEGVESRESLLLGSHSDYPDSTRWMTLQGVLLRSDLTWQHALDGNARLEMKLGVTHNPRHSTFEFHQQEDGRPGAALRRVTADIRDTGVTFSGKHVAPLGSGHALALGWDTGYTDRSQTRLEHDSAAGRVYDDRYRGDIARLAVFAQDEWDAGAGWSLSTGLRWESLTTAVAQNGQPPARQRSAVPSPVMQAMYKLSTERQLRLGLARTYKAPGMTDLIPRRYTADNNNSPNNPDTQGNPNLRPELAWGLDAGYDHYFGKDSLLGASVYARRIDGVTLPLLFLDGARWVRMQANQGRAQARGFALEAKMAVTQALSLRGNLARNWSRTDSVPGPDNRLDRQTSVSANVGFDWQTSAAFKLGADLNYQGGGRTRLSQQVDTSAPALRKLDLYGVWNLGEAGRVRVGGANLLQRNTLASERYSDADGVRRLDTRTAGAAVLRVSFERGW
jgi:outer membrane receptor for ferrienterochelin and colicin